MNANLEEQEDELLALESIFGSEEFLRKKSKSAGEIRVSVELPADFTVLLKSGGTLRQYDISFLPPLLLTFELPEDYPSSSPPSSTLTCSWLTHTQLASLSAQLTDLYHATGGSVVLFTWTQFLREDSLKFLDIHSQLELPSDERGNLSFNRDNGQTESSEAEGGEHKSGRASEQCCNVSDRCGTDRWEPRDETQQNHLTSERSSTGPGGASALDIQKNDQSNLTSALSQSSLASGSEADYPNTLSSEAVSRNLNEHVSETPPVKSLESNADNQNVLSPGKSKLLTSSQRDRAGCDNVLNEEDLSASAPPRLNSSGPQDLTKQEAASLPARRSDSSSNGHQTVPGVSLTPSQILLSQILIHDASQKQKAFAATVFDCGVCYLGWLGSECVQLHECGHVFCRACLGEFCKVRITEGNVQGVTCLHEGCTASPTPAQVKSLVGEELFSRYDRLLLQFTLDRMSDVTYCPRSWCGSAVIREKSSNAALCTVCGFAFCVLCRKTYHGANRCYEEKTETDEMSKNALQSPPRSEEGLRALLDDYATGSKQRRRLLESRYGRKMLTSTLESSLSENWKVNNTKACPHCFSPIQKDGGCNNMWCIQCQRPFNWVGL